jgi:hypothetical protein
MLSILTVGSPGYITARESLVLAAARSVWTLEMRFLWCREVALLTTMVDGLRGTAIIINLGVRRSRAGAALRLLCWSIAAAILAASRDNLR